MYGVRALIVSNSASDLISNRDPKGGLILLDTDVPIIKMITLINYEIS